MFIRCGGNWNVCGCTLFVPRGQLAAGGIDIILAAWVQIWGGGLTPDSSGGISAVSFQCRHCLHGKPLVPRVLAERILIHCVGNSAGRCSRCTAVPTATLQDFPALEGALRMAGWLMGSGYMTAPEGTMPTWNPLCPDHAREVDPDAYTLLMQNRQH